MSVLNSNARQIFSAKDRKKPEKMKSSNGKGINSYPRNRNKRKSKEKNRQKNAKSKKKKRRNSASKISEEEKKRNAEFWTNNNNKSVRDKLILSRGENWRRNKD